jgi:hypothetical protein
MRITPYWTYQIAGWSLHGLVTAAIPTLYGGLRWVVVLRAIVGVLLGLTLTDRLRRHMKRAGWLRLPLRRLVLRVFAATLVISAIMVLVLLPLLLAFIPPPRAGPLSAIVAGHSATILAWCVIYLGFHYLRGVRTAEAEKWRLELAMRDTELLALRAQLNPHFLFNSLNSLRGLVAESPARAQDAITALAALLRNTLQLSRARTTTLGVELEATRNYLELEALRFEARLQYQIDIEPAALEHPVPPLLLQTVVENAVKHGIAQLPDGGIVRIAACKRNGDLHLRVTNTGTLSGDLRGGIGLTNSIERLRLLFGDRAQLAVRCSEPDEVVCEIVVPSPRSQSAFVMSPPPPAR